MKSRNDKSPANVSLGQVCLSGVLDWHAGSLTAKDGHKLVTVFLGTTPVDKAPDVDGILTQLGWSKGHFYEVQARGVNGGEIRTFFSAPDPTTATLDCIRYCERALQAQGGPAVMQLVMVRIGPVDAKGMPNIKTSKPIFGWNAQAGVALDHIKRTLTK